ncbi:hypothetical protein [Dactylosporangium sp. CA-139066]|uniref:hypothetical protein n=1 Tax=Dactylosporangium sp. CA-139066 TaxID=3239930 RepID=UPI003D938D29
MQDFDELLAGRPLVAILRSVPAPRASQPHLPGVATASEVHHALNAGCRWLKAFPAGSLGPGWLPEMRGPFPEARFVPMGGIDAGNARAYLAAGAAALGVGSAVTHEDTLAVLLAVLAAT